MYGEDVIELIASERRSVDMSSAKNEEKMPASEVPAVKIDFPCSSLLTVCHKRLAYEKMKDCKLLCQ